MICGNEAKRLMRAWLLEPTLALAIGHPLHGDDALGPLVCAQAEGRAVDCGDAPERYLGLAGDPAVNRVLLIDAVDFGGAPGEVVFCTPEDLTERAGTTHTTGLAVLARYLQETYAKPVAVLGVQPAETRFGAGVSEAVRAAAAEVSDLLKERPAEREAVWTRS